MSSQIIGNQPHEAYLDAPGVSSGMIKLCHQKTPYHVWDSYINPERQDDDDGTESMDLGRALHERFLLGEEAFDKRYIIAEKIDKRTKEGKAQWAALVAEAEESKKTIIRPGEDVDHLERMVRSLRNNDIIAARMEGTERELSCYSGNKKCRFDAVGGETSIAIDLKTISEITPHNISAHIARYGYHIQAAWYLMVAEELEMPIHYNQFCFIFVESKPPYDVAIRLLSPDAIALGRDIVDTTYPEIVQCMETDVWPGFGHRELVAELPLYAYTSDK